MTLPNNTYYHQGALINNNRHNNNLKQKIAHLETIVDTLKQELINVNKRIDELNNKQT
jgi:hypothetical protein